MATQVGAHYLQRPSGGRGVLLGGAPGVRPARVVVLGAGNGLFSSPNTASAMALAAREGLGGAAGLLSTARNAGVVCGLGVAGAAYTAATRGGASGRADAVAAAVFVDLPNGK